MSPILFCVYWVDELITCLIKLKAGCYIGHTFAGVLNYADDVTLLAPTYDTTMQMLRECEKFADNFDVLIIIAKSQTVLFTAKCCVGIKPTVLLKGKPTTYADNTFHLGS